jgi:uncharacterized membrane protein
MSAKPRFFILLFVHTSVNHLSYLTHETNIYYLLLFICTISILCLCRAFAAGLSISISCAMDKCYSVGCHVACVVCSLLCVWFLCVCVFVIVYGPCLRVDRGNYSSLEHFGRGFIPPWP